MAVYKATYCYPFLNAVDIRVAVEKSAAAPAQYLKCRVDTSNKDVTGYRVRILDGDNNVIFPIGGEGAISPIQELQRLPSYRPGGTNSGVNGTYLQIPFFQNAGRMALNSANAVYYIPRYAADRVIMSKGLAASSGLGEPTRMEDISNWEYRDGDGSLEYRWDESSDSEKSDFESNAIWLGGELLNASDTVLIVSDDPADFQKTGLWVVDSRKTDGDGAKRTALFPMDSLVQGGGNKPAPGEMLVAKKTKRFHNKVWRRKEGGQDSYEYVPQSEPMWAAYGSDSRLTPVKGIGVGGMTFKWEITLYQGDGEIIGSADSPIPMAISYDGIDEEWLDMAIGTGKVLGSTSQRVQIASGDGEGEEAFLPQGQGAPLVLQTRFMDLTNLYDQASGSYMNPGIFNGTRVRVQNYDSAYGHAYPQTDSLDSSIVDSSTHVQFFKHSNDPEYILKADIVDYGFSDPVRIGRFNPSDKEKDGAVIPGSSIDARIYIEKGADWDVITPRGIAVGQTILFTDARDESGNPDAKRNGVYSLETTEELELVAGEPKKPCYIIKRAPSYGSWSSYIGKVIYSAAGSAMGNIESLANAGTFSLWDPRSSTSGSSPLLFTNEMPILLFPQKLGKNRTFNLFDADHDGSGASSFDSPLVDGQDVQQGDLILYRDGASGVVSSVSEDGYTIAKGDPIVDRYDLFYVTEGGKFGHRAWRDPGDPQGDWSLFTAKILKNSEEYTYISPISSLSKGMSLKFSNGKSVTFQGDAEPTQWMKVLGFDGVTYRIKHRPLSRDSEGVEYKNNGHFGIVSQSDGSADASIPWKYEARSFFRASDENAFYSYETPYVLFKKQGRYYSDLALVTVGQEQAFWTSDGQQLQDSDESDFYVSKYSAQSMITSRNLQLGGEFVQFQQASWESYRWVLLDADGKELQDTDKKYDKNMEVYFYGLANDTDRSNVYYAVLYVEDSLGDMLKYVIRFEVGQSASDGLPVPFTAEFDCKTQSVVLSYRDTGIPMPSYSLDGGVSVAYAPESFGSYGIWDGGIDYSDGSMSVLGDHGMATPSVDYRAGSNIFGTDAEAYKVSNAVKYGVGYSKYFTRSTHEVDSESSDQQIGIPGDGKGFYFDTQIRLSENFCGEILAVNVEGKAGSDAADPDVRFNDVTHLKGYVSLVLDLPESFVGGVRDSDHLNPKRNRFRIRAIADRNGDGRGSLERALCDGYFGPDLVTFETYNVPRRFYIQKAGSATAEGGEYLDYQFSDGKEYWCRSIGGGRYISSSEKFLGNINLVSGGDIQNNLKADVSKANLFNISDVSENAPSYWAESRRYLHYGERTDLFEGEGKWHISLPNSKAAMVDAESGMLRWPSSDQEKKYFWNETPSEDPEIRAKQSAYWDDVGPETPYMDEVEAVDRHPGSEMGKTDYRITIRMTDVDALYSAPANGASIQFDGSGNCAYITVQGGLVGSIRITPLKNRNQ